MCTIYDIHNCMTFSVRELILEDKKCPYQDWFSILDRKIQLRVDARVVRFEKGNLGDHRHLGDGLFEARLFFGPGYRIYFGKINNHIILLLCGGDKSSQDKDIEKARKLLKNFLEDNNVNEKS